nr:hypothetical protein [Propionicimonas sp.]
MAADWPQDPRLDPFRNAVWELSRGGRVEAYLTCRVVPVRQLWAKRESVWYQLHWLDGRRERPQADSGPVWSVVADLEHGRFEVLDVGDRVLDARPLTGPERDALWQRYGPPA